MRIPPNCIGVLLAFSKKSSKPLFNLEGDIDSLKVEAKTDMLTLLAYNEIGGKMRQCPDPLMSYTLYSHRFAMQYKMHFLKANKKQQLILLDEAIISRYCFLIEPKVHIFKIAKYTQRILSLEVLPKRSMF